MLNQGLNKVKIEGILSEVNVRSGEYNSSDGKLMPYLSGNIKVRVPQDIGGIHYDMEVPVSFFAPKYTRAGKDNPAYKSISELNTNFVSIAAADSIEKADRIRITTASLSENIFYNANDQMISYGQISSSFFNKIDSAKCFPGANFEVVICLAGIKDEVNSEGDSTGRIILQGILPQYGGKVDVLNFVVENPSAIDYIQHYWNVGDTVKVMGVCKYITHTDFVEEEVGFGDPIRTPRTRSINEFVVTSGSPGALEMAYDKNEIHDALEERQARIATLKTKQKKAPTKKNEFDNLGF